MRWLVFVIACAHADPQALYQRGRADYQRGRYQRAIDAFAEAYRATGEPELLYDMAQAFRRDHALDKALPLYRAYLQKAPHAANRAEVEERIADLRARR